MILFCIDLQTSGSTVFKCSTRKEPTNAKSVLKDHQLAISVHRKASPSIAMATFTSATRVTIGSRCAHFEFRFLAARISFGFQEFNVPKRVKFGKRKQI